MDTTCPLSPFDGYKTSETTTESDTGTTMSTPKYKLPPPVYLPSSGGHTSSRLTQEPFHRRVFAFRRWSIDEDGRLVCRTRQASRDSRPKPYDRPSRPLAFVTPNDQDARKTTSQDQSTKVKIDGPTLSQLFQNLAPLIKESSSDFDSKATVICSSLGLDPVTSGEIVNSFKMQFVESSPLNRPPPASRPNTETTAQRTPPATGSPTSAPVPSTSTAALVPIRFQRPFSSGSKGYTVWYSTESNHQISSPPSDLPTSAGILYLHKNLACSAVQVWLCDIRRNWVNITNAQGIKHPSLADRILLLRSDGLPSWLTAASYAAIQARKESR